MLKKAGWLFLFGMSASLTASADVSQRCKDLINEAFQANGSLNYTRGMASAYYAVGSSGIFQCQGYNDAGTHMNASANVLETTANSVVGEMWKCLAEENEARGQRRK